MLERLAKTLTYEGDVHPRQLPHQEERGDAAVRRLGQRAHHYQLQPVGDSQPDALCLRAGGGEQREQHERVPVRGDQRLSE